ncbi:hypothetical protein [Oscillatoria sp. FACHB-1406]|uniref:hypothetical protein n=1 Tax=Oscillatoria sp. FACHB-1406 TaxID=2692846 RepID=UPI001689BFCA|nr:hypothetical protein [Oscillatoria sp. FACHB-1406]MBD2578943.1 hypothetical protein [Oscillatoria sp. FACHB-1406]
MSVPPNPEPTLSDVLDRIDGLATSVGKLSTSVGRLSTDVDKLSTDVEHLSNDVGQFNERFSNYQQATQWGVQLVFTLIASATITAIVTTVLKK